MITKNCIANDPFTILKRLEDGEKPTRGSIDAIAIKGYLSVLEYLYSNKYRVSTGAANYVAIKGDIETLKFLLDHGHTFTARTNHFAGDKVKELIKNYVSKSSRQKYLEAHKCMCEKMPTRIVQTTQGYYCVRKMCKRCRVEARVCENQRPSDYSPYDSDGDRYVDEKAI